ncbi:MAG TPA: hypothetical protein VF788_17545, partial [Pseudonocardiaceae bacterium]
DGEGIEQQQPVAPLRVADAGCREAQAEALAKLLKPGEVECVSRGDLTWPVPDVVPFGVNGDDKAILRSPENPKILR